MKACVLFIHLWLSTVFSTVGEIKNGYVDIAGARASLKSLRILLDHPDNIPLMERESMKRKCDRLIHYITYYELTERLLAQFRNIAGDLYNEIDTLKDSKGRSVSVYVRFVDEKDLTPGVAGTTSMEQDEADPEAYSSAYGANTVAVTIAVNRKSLALLAHELGHVQYQVKNLSEYMHYYKKSYGENYNRLSLGHNDHDPSGKKASHFVKRFRDQLLRFTKVGKGKPKSHLTMLREIEKALRSF